MAKSNLIARRRFLIALGFSGLGAAIGATLLWQGREGITHQMLRPAYDRFLAPNYEPLHGELPNDAWPALHALAESIYPPADEAERDELKRVIARWTRDRTEADGMLALYVEGIAALSDLGRRSGHTAPFAELTATDRLKVLATLEAPEIEGPGGLVRVRAEAYRFRLRRERFLVYGLRDDLIDAIFSTRLGWHLVGNTSTWPGVPGEQTAVTHAPGSF